jgi:MoaA/NifB/PqqE/SkfB family radical SAM enzyme
MKNDSIHYLKIFVSFRCNLSCIHCVHAAIASNGQNDQVAGYEGNIQNFLSEIAALNPGIKVYLSGGEPLLSKRFFEIGKLLKSLGLKYKTITNGTLLQEKINELLEAPPASIWITFNGIGDVHDRIVRKKNAFENLVKHLDPDIKTLKKAGIRVGAVFMINQLTFRSLSRDLEFFRDQGFDEVVVQHLSYLSEETMSSYKFDYHEHFKQEPHFCFGENAYGSSIDAEILYEEIQKVIHTSYPFETIIFPGLKDLLVLKDYYSEKPQFWKTSSCKRAMDEWWIMPDGKVCACYAHQIGNISNSYDELLHSVEWKEWKENFERLKSPLEGCMRCHRLYM